MRGPDQQRRRLSAFTLIELLIVISIIGITAFLGMTLFGDFIGFSQLKKDGWTLISDMRGYRQAAIAEHVEYRFSFNLTDNSYTVEQRDAATGTLVRTVGTTVLESNIISATTVGFKPRGEAVPGAIIDMQMKDGTDTVRITVHAATGLATLEEL